MISAMGLKFENTDSLETVGYFWDLSEETKLEYEAASDAVHEMVKKDTDDATSLVYSGPTSASADRVVKRLLFPCQGRGTLCVCTDDNRYLLNQLMPTKVDGFKRDLCYDAFKSHTEAKGEDLSRKKFKLGVIHLRTAEKFAVTLQDQRIRREGGVAKGEDASEKTFK